MTKKEPRIYCVDYMGKLRFEYVRLKSGLFKIEIPLLELTTYSEENEVKRAVTEALSFWNIPEFGLKHELN